MANDENARLRSVIAIAAQNISSLMCAYPDSYPRHAFQGTYDLLSEAIVGSSAQVPTIQAELIQALLNTLDALVCLLDRHPEIDESETIDRAHAAIAMARGYPD